MQPRRALPHPRLESAGPESAARLKRLWPQRAERRGSVAETAEKKTKEREKRRRIQQSGRRTTPKGGRRSAAAEMRWQRRPRSRREQSRRAGRPRERPGREASSTETSHHPTTPLLHTPRKMALLRADAPSRRDCRPRRSSALTLPGRQSRTRIVSVHCSLQAPTRQAPMLSNTYFRCQDGPRDETAEEGRYSCVPSRLLSVLKSEHPWPLAKKLHKKILCRSTVLCDSGAAAVAVRMPSSRSGLRPHIGGGIRPVTDTLCLSK